VRAYNAALGKWFLPTLSSRSLDRITTSDVEHVMRDAGLADKSIRKLRRLAARPVQLRDRSAAALDGP
jgi:hypothetical protein